MIYVNFTALYIANSVVAVLLTLCFVLYLPHGSCHCIVVAIVYHQLQICKVTKMQQSILIVEP